MQRFLWASKDAAVCGVLCASVGPHRADFHGRDRRCSQRRSFSRLSPPPPCLPPPPLFVPSPSSRLMISLAPCCSSRRRRSDSALRIRHGAEQQRAASTHACNRGKGLESKQSKGPTHAARSSGSPLQPRSEPQAADSAARAPPLSPSSRACANLPLCAFPFPLCVSPRSVWLRCVCCACRVVPRRSRW